MQQVPAGQLREGTESKNLQKVLGCANHGEKTKRIFSSVRRRVGLQNASVTLIA